MKAEKIIVEMGLKRGGTSIVALTLHRHGVCMGERLAEATEHNPDGYYEDLDFADVTGKLLAGASIENGIVVKGGQEALEEFQQLIDRRNQTYRMWGLKNFGLNYLFFEFVRRCDPIDVYLLRVTRPFHHACESWAIVRNVNILESISEQAHLLFNMDKIYHRHTGPKLTVAYPDLLHDTETTIRRITDWLGVEMIPETANILRRPT